MTAQQMTKPTCNDCQYYDPTPGTLVGECHAIPSSKAIECREISPACKYYYEWLLTFTQTQLAENQIEALRYQK